MPKRPDGSYSYTMREIHASRLRSARRAIQSTPDYPDQGDQSALGDLLGNLHHWAKAKGLDWEHAVHMGEAHFDEEQDELPKCRNCNEQGCDPCGAMSPRDCLCTSLQGDNDA